MFKVQKKHEKMELVPPKIELGQKKKYEKLSIATPLFDPSFIKILKVEPFLAYLVNKKPIFSRTMPLTPKPRDASIDARREGGVQRRKE